MGDGVMSEQPLPTPGGAAVEPIARSLFNVMLTERTQRGVQTYGMALTSHNGRDAVRDAMEEATDLWQYLVQIGLEREAMLALIADLRAEIASLRGPHVD